VLTATSSNFLFRRERIRPSRIIEFILLASMRPFCGCAQVPGRIKGGTGLVGNGWSALDYRALDTTVLDVAQRLVVLVNQWTATRTGSSREGGDHVQA